MGFHCTNVYQSQVVNRDYHFFGRRLVDKKVSTSHTSGNGH